MRQRKKTTLDGIDRDILRFMRGADRSLTGNQIAGRVNISPSAIRPRLNNLRNKGIIKTTKIGETRTFNRKFETKKGDITKTIQSPSVIKWKLDLWQKKKKIELIRKKLNKL